MANIKILVCCHKKDVCVTKAPYFPVQMGKKNALVDLGIQGDDTGDNISEKNANYAELTGIYWAWKNLKNVDVIGLCHYRRYFDFYGKCRRFMPFEEVDTADLDKLNLEIPEEIIQSVLDGKVVVSKPLYYLYNIATDYCVGHVADDLKTLQHVFKATQTEKFVDAFNVVMYQRNSLIHYNMFLMSWDNFDKYCKWLFGLFFEYEKNIDVTHYNARQTRVFGYMGERMFNVYLEAEKLPLIKKPVFKVTDTQYHYSPYHFLVNRLRGTLATFFARTNSWHE